ncbi:MAG: ribonuclease HI [bacterium]
MKIDANSGWIGKDNFYDNKTYLYTDGACSGNPGPGGYAALIINGDNEYEISGYEPDTTNNQMEMKAVIEGLKEIKIGSEVKLISDSNYVLNGLQNWIYNWKKRNWKTASNKPVKNKELWMELDELTSKFNIDYIKVKGHSGNKYNERVDSIARLEIEENKKI